MPTDCQQTIFRLKRDIGLLKKGNHVVIIAVAKCCGCNVLIKKVDAEVYQYCYDNDIKKIK